MQGISKAFFILSFLLILVFFQSIAQTSLIKGQVIDFDTRDALAFVNIQVNEGPEGCISDIDGKFIVKSTVPVYKLKLSYIGYESTEFKVENEGKEILIRLKKTIYQLPGIVIKPGINPAHRIISEAISNRYINDHEHLPSFSYTSYEKMVFGPESDSIPAIDSLAADSSYIKAKAFFKKQHLFITESVVKRSFRFPADNYNKVIASRVSGFSDPLFIFLISQLQSTTFYKEVIKIVDKNYINPISNGSFKKYYFEIQDTIIEPYPYDTTFVISFRPLLNTNFDGLKGSVSISTNGYAIRNVIAMPARDEGLFSVKIQQQYDFINNIHWFPVQLNTELIVKNSTITIDSAHKTRLKMKGRGKSYISDINLDPKLRRDRFGAIEVDVQPDAYRQSEELWNKYREDSLSSRDQITYQFIDSIGKSHNFDKLNKRIDALLKGKITYGFVDLYLDNLFRVNHHEGARAGLKLSTSDNVSKWFRLSGYGAYGFKDMKWKYGADGTLIFSNFSNFHLKVGFYDDVDEAGADTKFTQSRNLLNPERFRDIMVDRMDHTRGYDATFSSRILKYMTVSTGLSVYNRTPGYNYKYIVSSSENIDVTSSGFSFTEASFSMRYAYGEKFLKNTRSAISLGTDYPVIQFSMVHGFNTLLGGQYQYNRFDLKINKSILIKYLGTTSFTFQAGFIDRDIPYVNLYNSNASFTKLFTVYSPGSFATMRMNEFTADRYASLFMKHNFGKLLFRSKYFKPEPELVTNLGIGLLSHPENHLGETIRGYEKGYFESGLVLNKLIRLGITDVGFAWFYRYGPYAMPTIHENMALKIVFQFVL
ncbi:MAG: DUF5686 family protein [Lentimicrobiaceae bacterium]|jgi:hypothetical protein